MKVGDLVRRFHRVPDFDRHGLDFGDLNEYWYGVVMQLSRTGYNKRSAKVVFVNGEQGWYDTKKLELISESR